MEEIKDYERKIKDEIEQLITRGHYEEAEKIIIEYENIIDYCDVDIYSLKAVLYIMMGDKNKAEELLIEGLLIDGNNIDLIQNIAYLYNNTDRHLAIYYYRKLYYLLKEEDKKEEIKEIIYGLGGNLERRVLIGSPIYQKDNILCEFLKSLKEIYKDNFIVDYYFIDDNIDDNSSILLKKFSVEGSKVYIEKSIYNDVYNKDSKIHHWDIKLIDKVAKFKDNIISFAKENQYDYLFLIDSDIVINKYTIEHLMRTNKDIISEIFWTKWTPDSIELPQVWLEDQYTHYVSNGKEQMTDEEKHLSIYDFISTLRKPGIYRIGGLGACTLISLAAIKRGVSFKKINNISFIGEDRDFCVRAEALGIKLFVDTNYPAFHIYRESDLENLDQYKQSSYNKLNILQMYDYMKIGGAETHIITLSNELKKMGHNIYIASPKGESVDEIKRNNINHIECDLYDINKIDENILFLKEVIKKYKINIIHVHPYISQIVACNCSIQLGVPVVTTLHSKVITPSLNKPFRNNIRKYICISEETKRAQKQYGYNESDLVYIPNSVELGKAPDESSFFLNKEIRMLYISRIDKDKVKSIMNLLSTIPVLVKNGLSIKLEILGDGECIEEVKEVSNGINEDLKSQVIDVLGSKSNIKDLIDESDIVIGVGRVVLEGLANGRFTICLGNDNYPGIIDTNKLLNISEVNFTERNTNRKFNKIDLYNDIYDIYYNFNKHFNDLLETYNTVKENYSIQISARKHIETYLNVLKGDISFNEIDLLEK